MKSIEIGWNTTRGRGIMLYITDAQSRKHGEQNGFDTQVVRALDEEWLIILEKETFHLGSTVATQKSNKVGGISYQQWSMWFNLRIRKNLTFPIL